MGKEQVKIAHFIARLRKQRGMTQKQLADLLGTSQSAVNRIEGGKQNLTMDMLAKISRALDKEIITLSSGKMNFQIEGGKKLRGSIDVKTSKNAAVVLLCAALLNKNTTTLKNVARIEEVNRLIEVLQSIGVSVEWKGQNDLIIKPPAKLKLGNMDKAAGKRTRSIIMFMGPLIHDFDKFSIPLAGGCKLGTRTVRPHLWALERLGVRIKTTDNYYHVTAKRPRANEIVLVERGDTVTENAIMAAARINGTTVIRNASFNYMVQDLCFFLEELGIRIEGIGTSTLTIHGKHDIDVPVTYNPSQDPIEAMSLLTAGIVTKSSITIRGCPIRFLEIELQYLEKMGFKYDIIKRYKAANGKTDLVDIKTLPSKLVAFPDKIHSQPFPGINIDNLPFFIPIAAMAEGTTFIHDWTYEDRLIYSLELKKLGVRIRLADIHRIYVDGPPDLQPAEVICPPALRPGMTVMLMMLAADGTSVLRDVYSISRGYEDMANRLNDLGARITVLRDL